MTGWLRIPEKTSASQHVHVFLNNKFWQSLPLEIERPDILATARNKAMGFEVDVSELLSAEADQHLSFYDSEGLQLNGSPYTLGDQHFDYDAEVVDGVKLRGVIKRHGLAQDPVYIRILLDDVAVGSRVVTFHTNGSSGNPAPGVFEYELSHAVLDGKEHKVSISILAENQEIPLSNQLFFQSKYVGSIDYISTRKIVGWVSNLSAPGVPVDLDVLINGKPVAIERANLPYQAKTISGINLGNRIGFDIDLPLQGASNSVLEIEIKVSGCDTRVFYESHVFTAYDTALRSLEYCVQQLNQVESETGSHVAGLPLSRLDVTWVRENLLAPIMREIRRNRNLPNNLNINLSHAFKNAHIESSEIVDVIIPVYKGKEETLHCIDRVLNSAVSDRCDVIVINDHSPDPELTVALKKLASSGQITLIEHTKNQGFVRSVNAGMRVHQDRDVILLNSDTLVPMNWVERLHAAAYQSDNIGTVTPFTNNGTICSFPEINVDNKLPDGWDIDQLDKLFSSTKSDVYDIPTAVGFCMYIKRQALDEVGYFDEDNWKKGYGEENDFCLRAGVLGWRSVIATNIFVQHLGSLSFSTSKELLIAENLPKLNQLYPDYEARVNRFVKADPLARYRNPVIKKLLSAQANRYMLFIVHSLGGGAGYAADYLTKILHNEGEKVLVLSKLPNQQWEISCPDSPYRLVYDYPQDYPQLIEDLSLLRTWHVHYHQTMDFEVEVLNLADKLGVTYDFTAHDFMPICPRVNFVDETERFCGNSRFSVAICNRCVALDELPQLISSRYRELNSDVSQWRLRYEQFLKGARRVLAPSGNTATYYKDHFDLKNIVVKPHPEEVYKIPVRQLPLAPPEVGVTVAVIGGIGLHKGFSVLIQCAQRALKDQLPIKFIVIGHTFDDELALELPNIEVTGEYRHDQLPNLIRQYACKVAVFFNIWPETFSYTLSEAWQNGLYPVAYDMGAIAERIKEVGFGELISIDSTSSEINQVLIQASSKLLEIPQKTLGSSYHPILEDYYDLAKKG